jgi:hypothetical protein
LNGFGNLGGTSSVDPMTFDPEEPLASLQAHVESLSARLQMLEAHCEQLRYGMGQLARENAAYQARMIKGGKAGFRRTRKVAHAVLRRLGFRPGKHASSLKGQTGCPSVFFFGDGASGSWLMRAVQIAGTRQEWVAKPQMTRAWRVLLPGFKVFCFIKRFDPRFAARMRAAGRIVVYDVVDPWKQPDDGLAHPTLPDVIDYFRKRLSSYPLDGVIFPNETMKEDLGKYVPNPVTIYHHHRIGLPPIEVRRQARMVAYEGRVDFLGPWLEIAQRVCRRLNLRLAINPPSLADADIGLAARGGMHGSLMAQRYKSNVKLANFYAAGLPCVVHADEMSCRETAIPEVRSFSTEQELEERIRSLLPYEERCRVHQAFLAASRRYRLEHVAEQYESYFRRLVEQQSQNAGDALPAAEAA